MTKTPKLYIAVNDNGMGLSRTKWAVSMMGACLSVLRDRELVIQGFSHSCPAAAANITAADFLATDCDELLFIDTDIEFTPKQLEMLLEHDVPLVSGIYCKKKLGIEFPIVTLDTDPNPFQDKSKILVEVQAVPKGFLRIKREVFNAMLPVAKTYDCPERERVQSEYFVNLVGGHSEDFGFCDLYRSVGGKIMVDARVTTMHIGSITYPVRGSEEWLSTQTP